ncbi:glycoside hydrolase/deacetylase [Panus rudis PR-1116 ss-1]|nr:glycoside hydrolase/deacetylase [Panus rudis PR-1116 ss-1]
MSPALRALLLVAALANLFTAVFSASVPSRTHDDHDHAPVHKRLPGTWYQRDDSPVHKLFKRAGTDGQVYAQVGSPTWASGYPRSTPDPNQLPQQWVDALNAAVSAGKIPNFPPSTATGGNPTYPGQDPNSDVICSTTYKCRKNPDNIYDAPQGVIGISFDDGPLPTSDKLYQFLEANNQPATHFFIGVNILNNPKEFNYAFATVGNDIAVHTWTHPYMTTLDNMAVLGQLGWTMEIIHNSTGGRLPKYWRPPFGDSDNRVNAIAKEVFGLTTVIWNQDTEDWSLTSGGTTPQKINASMTQWLTGPKNPGLIMLEHELSDQSVQAFIDGYPVMKSNGWKTVSVAQLDGQSAYQNSPSNTGDVTPMNIILSLHNGTVDSSSDAAPSSTASSSSGSSSTHATSSTSAPSSTASATGGVLQNGARPQMASFQVQGVLIACLAAMLSAAFF